MKREIAATIINVPCPDCGELSPEPIERIVHNDVIPCSLCGGLIDLSADDCKLIVSNAKNLWLSSSR
jgi:endogenous inhibitor of DNA gyrase (YacG/DUF329 family)